MMNLILSLADMSLLQGRLNHAAMRMLYWKVI